MPCRRSIIPGSRMQLWTFLADRTYQRDIKPVPTLSCGGVFRYRSGERLHGMQEVTGSIPVISTRNKKHRTEMCGVFLLYPFRLAAARQSTFPKGTAFRGSGKLSGSALRRPLGGAGALAPEGVLGSNWQNPFRHGCAVPPSPRGRLNSLSHGLRRDSSLGEGASGAPGNFVL